MLLYRYLLNCQVASRRKSNDYIKTGQVKVNGEVVRNPIAEIDERKDAVLLNDNLLKQADDKKVYIILNKPPGYICSLEDRHAKNKVLDLVDVRERIYPIGRLDKNTRGLILLTNDGELAHRVTHPSYEIDKVYEVFVKPFLKAVDIKKLEKGVEVEEGVVVAAEINSVRHDETKKGSLVNLTIHQGLKRQIRYMFLALHYKVHDLIRLKVGNLELKDLKEGKYRNLTQDELAKLKDMVRIRDDKN
jgi:23S rRNA pseudouridine2605 synthase